MSLFSTPKPVIGCIHLKALPGAPLYAGSMTAIIEQALAETEIYLQKGVDGLIVENFNDYPFYPDKLPAETIAAFAVVAKEIKRLWPNPIGINALRNDANTALAIATAIEAEFMRVNLHMHAVVCDQGVLTGRAYETLRLKRLLGTSVKIWADVQVKHARPLAAISLQHEVADLNTRGLVDALIVSGNATGNATDLADLTVAKQNSSLPVIIGSGLTPDNLPLLFPQADGFIVGSYFKEAGQARNNVDAARVAALMQQKGDLMSSYPYPQHGTMKSVL